MITVIGVALALVAIGGTAVAITTDPERQAVTLSAFGLTLVLLFMALQAPDVALSQLGVGSVLVPLMMMLTVRKLRRHR